MILTLILSDTTYYYEIRSLLYVIIKKCVSDQKPFYPLKGRYVDLIICPQWIIAMKQISKFQNVIQEDSGLGLDIEVK